MTEQGAALQTYNNELVKCLEELCERRAVLQKEIEREEEEKKTLENKVRFLQEKLDTVNSSLKVKQDTREKYNKTIKESEQAYLKILESSQVLLNVVKKDAKELRQNEVAARKALPL